MAPPFKSLSLDLEPREGKQGIKAKDNGPVIRTTGRTSFSTEPARPGKVNNHQDEPTDIDIPARNTPEGYISATEKEFVVVGRDQVDIEPSQTRPATVPPTNRRPEGGFVSGQLHGAIDKDTGKCLNDIGNQHRHLGANPTMHRAPPLGIDATDWERRIRERDFYPSHFPLSKHLNDHLSREINGMAMDTAHQGTPSSNPPRSHGFVMGPLPNISFNRSSIRSRKWPTAPDRPSTQSFAQAVDTHPPSACANGHRPDTIVSRMPHCDHKVCEPCTVGMGQRSTCDIDAESPVLTENASSGLASLASSSANSLFSNTSEDIPTAAVGHTPSDPTDTTPSESTLPPSLDQPQNGSPSSSPKLNPRLPRDFVFYAFGSDTYNIDRERSSTNWREPGHPIPSDLIRQQRRKRKQNRTTKRSTSARDTPSLAPTTTGRPPSRASPQPTLESTESRDSFVPKPNSASQTGAIPYWPPHASPPAQLIEYLHQNPSSTGIDDQYQDKEQTCAHDTQDIHPSSTPPTAGRELMEDRRGPSLVPLTSSIPQPSLTLPIDHRHPYGPPTPCTAPLLDHPTDFEHTTTAKRDTKDKDTPISTGPTSHSVASGPFHHTDSPLSPRTTEGSERTSSASDFRQRRTRPNDPRLKRSHSSTPEPWRTKQDYTPIVPPTGPKVKLGRTERNERQVASVVNDDTKLVAQEPIPTVVSNAHQLQTSRDNVPGDHIYPRQEPCLTHPLDSTCDESDGWAEEQKVLMDDTERLLRAMGPLKQLLLFRARVIDAMRK